MKKEEIGRDCLQYNIMKHIIFRFDYQGMIDSTDFVKLFQSHFSEFFGSYSKNTHNKVGLQLNDFEDVSNSLSIPISEIIKQDVHVFSENTFGSDKVTLNISLYNTILNIECINYKNIDPYIDFVNQYIKLLFESQPYINLKRFGLRKIGSNIYENFDDIHLDFEKKYFSFEKNYFDSFSLYECRIDDLLVDEKSNIKINFLRSLDSGIIFDEKTNESKNAFQVSLDLDAYLDEEALNQISYKTNLSSSITNINNEVLFNLFKNSVTEGFLNKNLAQ